MFLMGLEQLGKGDWRGISRNYVTTRTPTQVASHAQKYFLRQNSLNKKKRRSSLFDMAGANNAASKREVYLDLNCFEEGNEQAPDEQENGEDFPMASPSQQSYIWSYDNLNSQLSSTQMPMNYNSHNAASDQLELTLSAPRNESSTNLVFT